MAAGCVAGSRVPLSRGPAGGAGWKGWACPAGAGCWAAVGPYPPAELQAAGPCRGVGWGGEQGVQGSATAAAAATAAALPGWAVAVLVTADRGLRRARADSVVRGGPLGGRASGAWGGLPGLGRGPGEEAGGGHRAAADLGLLPEPRQAAARLGRSAATSELVMALVGPDGGHGEQGWVVLAGLTWAAGPAPGDGWPACLPCPVLPGCGSASVFDTTALPPGGRPAAGACSGPVGSGPAPGPSC